MNRELSEFLAQGAPSAAELDGFLAGRTFPLTDRSGATFVFRGDADEVNLRCWMSGLRTAQPFHRVEGSELWVYHMELPPRSRFEYKFEVIRGGHKELLLDPFNPVLARDPYGANSVCQGFGYERPAWTLEDADVRRGNVQDVHIASRAFGEHRSVQVYLPARFRKTRRYPLLIVHDGPDYVRFAGLITVLDNLIHRLEIPEMVVALTQSPARLTEYAADPRQSRFVVDELVPAMNELYPLEDSAWGRGIMGASLGAVASLHAAHYAPDMFGHLLLQSGSFAFSDIGDHDRGPVFDPIVPFVNSFRARPKALARRIYMSCGIYESLIYENRSLLPVLQGQGIEVKFEEARDAHNWENWRDRLRSGLSWLFPGPLWMVYE